MKTAIKVAGVVAAILISAFPVTASAAGPPTGLVLSSFELDGTNGYEVTVFELREADFPPTVAVSAHRERERADYEAPGELEPGVHAVFGSLGRVAVSFQRRKRSVDRPEKGCTWITETGSFKGEFSFVGEGGYTAAATTSAPGEVMRLPNGFCGLGIDRKGPRPPDLIREKRLVARSRVSRGAVEFETNRIEFVRHVWFEAQLREYFEPMTITRGVTAFGPRSTLKLGAGRTPRSATVRPPAPFDGEARFRDPPHGPPTWKGSLSVSLPGAPGVSLAGPSFAARLCAHTSVLGPCKVGPPRQAARSAQGSGSHSQPLALDRLSWSR